MNKIAIIVLAALAVACGTPNNEPDHTPDTTEGSCYDAWNDIVVGYKSGHPDQDVPEACETLNTEYNVVVAADPRCPSDACTFDATIYVNPDLTVPEQVEAVSKEWAKILNYCANGGDAPAGTNDFLWQQWIKGEAAYMKYLYEDATVCAK